MREMRRADRQLSQAEAMEVLNKGEYGILATVDSEGQPYGVPLSYAVSNNCIYFHGVNAESNKHDNILSNEKVSFTVVTDTKVLPDQFATLYKSTIILGVASLVENEEERLTAFKELLKKYSNDFLAKGEDYVKNAGPNTRLTKITIDSITGKGRIK